MKKAYILLLATVMLFSASLADSGEQFIQAFPSLKDFSTLYRKILSFYSLNLVQLSQEQKAQIKKLILPMHNHLEESMGKNMTRDFNDTVKQWLLASKNNSLPSASVINSSKDIPEKIMSVIDESETLLSKTIAEIEKILDNDQKKILRSGIYEEFYLFPLEELKKAMDLPKSAFDREKVSISERIVEKLFSKSQIKTMSRITITALEKINQEGSEMAKKGINPYFWALKEIIVKNDRLRDSYSVREAIMNTFFSFNTAKMVENL